MFWSNQFSKFLSRLSHEQWAIKYSQICKIFDIVVCNIGSHYSFQGSLNLAGVVDNHHKRPRGDERLPDSWIRDALKLEKERQRISDQKSSTMGSKSDGKAKRSRMWAPPLRLECFSDFLWFTLKAKGIFLKLLVSSLMKTAARSLSNNFFSPLCSAELRAKRWTIFQRFFGGNGPSLVSSRRHRLGTESIVISV